VSTEIFHAATIKMGSPLAVDLTQNRGWENHELPVRARFINTRFNQGG
jgi:hypothetical protein